MRKLFTYRFSTLCFLISITLLILIDFYYHISVWSYVGLSSLYLVIVGIGSSNIASGFHLKAICKGQVSEKLIAITFDDGPVHTITSGVLDILKTHQAPATFFCIGKRVLGNEEILKRISKEGHLIGNHTFSHAFWFDFYPSGIIKDELIQTNEIIKKVINKSPLFFRPPYGVTNPAIKKAVKQTQFNVIGWNKRSLDTVIDNEEKILKRITENLQGGDIVLFHDIHPRIFKVLEIFLQYTSKNGFKIVGLDHLINRPAYR